MTEQGNSESPTPSAADSAFLALGLDAALVAAVTGLGYEEPTDIQREGIPPLLAGSDVLGQAATGTGKTAAFALPMVQRIGASADDERAVRGLILVPTRELAMQVAEAVHRYGRPMGTRVLPIYGGQAMQQQLRALKRGVDESTPVHYDLADPKDGSEKFGTDKAQCERETQRVFGDRAIVVRPTYIVGPGDTSDRFPYWPQRLAKGGEVLAPGRRDDPMQIIDVRDLAEFMVRLLENKKTGIYNVAGPKTALTAREFYPAAAEALKADVKFTYVDDYDFLAAHKIEESIP
jgi:hypothetical protein